MDYHVLVIGSGAGGSVAALRLTQKGYRVGVLVAGRHNAATPKGPLDVPPDAFFASGPWAGLTDWKAELAPHYDKAGRVAGSYRYLAEQAGAVVHLGVDVTEVSPLPHGGYQLLTVKPGLIRWTGRVFTASQVVFATGAYGTLRLLRASCSAGALRRVSDQLGVLTWTNATVDPRTSNSQFLRDRFGAPPSGPLFGGCAIGASVADGVVDGYHRVFGHPGLHIMDGSTVCTNPGVNPALTITAQAERAISLWPNRGEPDPRPGLGAPYVSLARFAQ
jgi:glycine/D-amino acid oxidase-like deaminating enzyme